MRSNGFLYVDDEDVITVDTRTSGKGALVTLGNRDRTHVEILALTSHEKVEELRVKLDLWLAENVPAIPFPTQRRAVAETIDVTLDRIAANSRGRVS